MTVNYKSKKELLSKEINFCRSAARTFKILGLRNQVIREKWEKQNYFGKNRK
jgi:hypothetical protein